MSRLGHPCRESGEVQPTRSGRWLEEPQLFKNRKEEHCQFQGEHLRSGEAQVGDGGSHLEDPQRPRGHDFKELGSGESRTHAVKVGGAGRLIRTSELRSCLKPGWRAARVTPEVLT